MSYSPIVACIGAGQLARMLATEAGELGFTLRVLANVPDDSAALVCPQSVVGTQEDAGALRELLTDAAVLTFEHELISDKVFDAAAQAAVPVHPAAAALLYAKDKIAMRERLGALGLPMPRWANGRDDTAVRNLAAEAGFPLIAKVSHGGYDGRGVAAVASTSEFLSWRERLEPERACLVEEKIPFTRELAVLGARSASGELRTWDPVQTWQEEGQCAAVLAPAPGLDADVSEHAQEIARQIGTALGITGVFAVEMFAVESSGSAAAKLYINELAMRPHNSGHWTQDGCVTSQFEQHLRAVLDLPLGSTERKTPCTAMANVLGSRLDDPATAIGTVMSRFPNAKIHLYRKGNRPKRKLGHVNVTGTDPDQVLSQARAAANLLMGMPS